MGAYYTVVISDPALAQDAYVTKASKTSDRCAMQSHGEPS